MRLPCGRRRRSVVFAAVITDQYGGIAGLRTLRCQVVLNADADALHVFVQARIVEVVTGAFLRCQARYLIRHSVELIELANQCCQLLALKCVVCGMCQLGRGPSKASHRYNGRNGAEATAEVACRRALCRHLANPKSRNGLMLKGEIDLRRKESEHCGSLILFSSFLLAIACLEWCSLTGIFGRAGGLISVWTQEGEAMQSEIEPIVAALFERQRLAGKPTKAVAVMEAIGVDQSNDERYHWSWHRAGFQPDAIVTIWAEGVHAIDDLHWLSIESIDVQRRLGGKEHQAIEQGRAKRRQEIVTAAFQQKKPLMGMLQINRKAIAELRDNAVAKVAMRVKDEEPWWVAEFDKEKKLAVMVRGRASWHPTPGQIAAAMAKWATEKALQIAPPVFPPDDAPVLFINIAWMRRYEGHTLEDPVEGRNFGYLNDQGRTGADAHEQWSFKPIDGSLYGYIPRSPRARPPRIEIRRLGARIDEEEVHGVLVVFIARHPMENLLKVIGWYEDAVVHREEVYSIDRGVLQVRSAICAPINQAVVLQVADRHIVIPTAKTEDGGIGQSPLWYADQHPDLVARVRELVRQYRSKHSAGPPVIPAAGKGGGAPRNLDPANRLAVEKAAMELAMRYFDNTRDVSKEAKGWDIEGTDDSGTIYIEVKGLSGPVLTIELTPNEYEKMRLHRERYVIFVVTKALTQSAVIRVFRFANNGEQGQWRTDIGEALLLEERTGVRARLQ